MSNLARTFRTLRHLRLSQFYWRLRYRRESGRPAVPPHVPATLNVRQDFPRSLLLAEDDAPAEESSQDASDVEFVEQLELGRFVHLNESRELGTDSVDWLLGQRDTDRLWTVTLHYHAWAWRLARLVHENGELGRRADRLLRRLLGDWITRCDPTVEGSRALAWNAYAIATRIGWWCRLYHRLGAEGRATWGNLDTVFLESLSSQAAYLHNHLEWDLRANHLLRDAVGLAWAGRFFGGPRARRWLDLATRLAVEQAAEQVLPDGGHFERSPMYHVEVMNDFAVLGVLLEDPNARRQITKTWQRMAQFLAWVRHDDGQIPLFNDGGFNGTCTPAAMFAKGRELLQVVVDPQPREGGRFFADFGMAVWHGRPWSVLFDVGPVGVDYQPGHAHADTLAFEASYDGQRLFVDPGSFGYDDDQRRRYDRATASHNTVTVDETDSSEVWHVFRVGRRAKPVEVRFDAMSDSVLMVGGHTGYDHLPGRPRHRREIRIDASGVLTLVDRFEGRGKHSLSAGLLLDPAWSISETSDGWQLHCGEKTLQVVLADNRLDRAIRRVPYHPQYGFEQPTGRLAWQAVLQLPCEIVLRVEPSTPS
ncbi:MAG: alginate lyase family protein [Pirellulales bacterium]|nr:alginate lyase family protein [Pirellulales bacterium]